ncbi:MAG: toxin-antitoxin system HicB family antitoxin [Cyanothece sp. SIO1E1]|nr:toxin-antitoxin system HicB family antitoxin [Cyanothece sp. SIO1E1]
MDTSTSALCDPDDKRERLKEFAQLRGISVNKLIEELSTIALAEFDAYTRFRAMMATGDPQAGLQLLDKLDALAEESLQSENSEHDLP